MNQTHRISFLATLVLLFLLPIFFLPASILPLGGTKSLVLALGTIVAFVALIVDIMKKGALHLPKHPLLWGVFVLPLVYFLSAYLGTDKVRSLFGTNLEVGTFGYVLLVSALFGIIAYIYTDTSRVLRALALFFLSLSLLALFLIVKLVTGGSPEWGIFSGVMGNPIGAWTDYSVGFGSLALFSALALSTLPMKRMVKTLVLVIFFVSLALVAIINFSTTWVLLIISSVLLMVYLLTVEKKLDPTDGAHSKKSVVWPSILVTVVALVFIINPNISASGGIGDTLAGSLGVSNLDIRPSFSTTVDISRQALREHTLLGSGPNTFDRDWLLYKPQEVNNSAFWNISFPFGFGFLPTQVASVGLIGSLGWLAFLAFFLLLGGRALLLMPKDEWGRFSVVATFLVSLFFWVANFLYVPSRTVLALTFIFTGLFVATARTSGIVGEKEIMFSSKMAHNFVAVLVVIVLGVGAAGLALSVLQRTVSAYHFQQAVNLSNSGEASADSVQAALLRASQVIPNDSYYRTLSQLNVARAQNALNATTGTQQENQQIFQASVSNSIAAAQLAIDASPREYRNWLVLGTIYSSLVPAPFSVEGSYEAALEAFSEAGERNPTSPEIPLLLARLELDNGNAEEARQYLERSLELKRDYADAYFLLTQIELNENNITEAIRSAETGAFLTPNNAGVFFQLGLLKYTNRDWAGARDALTRAITLLPNYANAQYYLGLSEARLGNSDVALSLFQELERSNPDNEEVKTILSNLENGRDVLLGITPTDQSVTTRSNPPINEESQ